MLEIRRLHEIIYGKNDVRCFSGDSVCDSKDMKNSRNQTRYSTDFSFSERRRYTHSYSSALFSCVDECIF